MNAFSKKLIFAYEKIVKNTNKISTVSYDVESETIYVNDLNLKIVQSLNGISNIAISNFLYLCGTDEDNNNYCAGSHFFSYDTIKGNLTVLTNSIYNHHSPILVNYSQTMIFVLGGKNSKKCEVYDIIIHKWKTLPELPEVRYGSTSFIDLDTDCLYLFGGDSENNYSSTQEETNEMTELKSKEKVKDKLSILKINISANQLAWEKVELYNNNGYNMNRSFSTVFSAKGYIYLIGGFNSALKACDDILEIDLENNEFKAKLKLDREMTFVHSRETVNLNKGTFFMISDDLKINKLETNGFRMVHSDLKLFVNNSK